MNGEKKEYSLLWFIENYSYSDLDDDGQMLSPEFTGDGLGEETWIICLYPRRLLHKNKNLDSIFLTRRANKSTPAKISLKREISIISVDGSTLYKKQCYQTFKRGSELGFMPLLDMNELHLRVNTEYPIPETLGIRFRMWEGKVRALNVWQCTARTRIGIEKTSFIHRVENFSALELNESKTLSISSRSIKRVDFSSILYLIDTSTVRGAIVIIPLSSSSTHKVRKMKFSLIDVTGNIIDCIDCDLRFYEFDPEVDWTLTKQFIESNREKYLPNDVLSLLCEYTFTTGEEQAKIEETLHDIPVVPYKHRHFTPSCKKDLKIAEKLTTRIIESSERNLNISDHRITNVEFKNHAYSTNNSEPLESSLVAFSQTTNNESQNGELSMHASAQDDLPVYYNGSICTDIVLKTATKSFPAHRSVLCAKSSIFRAMLTNDMREKNSDCICVEDLDDETVRRLLLFLYSDHLEDLQWESAMRLYYAADKYAVEKLKVFCSSFLVDNISKANVCEVLILANTHNDSELKTFVEEIILEHDKEVFCSDEWERLCETNPLLVIRIMKLMYKQKK